MMKENKTKETYQYLFSVVIPVYNVEKYLEEAIDSVINQSIGFKNNIQLILVNDGSTDNSGGICTRYKKQYPDNVIYIEKKNGGVSSARNEGKKYVRGKYVNFFDSDDRWDKDAFKNVYTFFEKNYDDIDVVSCRYCFFEAREGFNHPLDYKYIQECVVDIHDQYSFIQLSAATTFIKSNMLKSRSFDEKLSYSEDSVFMFELILEKEQYGILPSAVYFYRKRSEETSALDIQKNDLSWYTETLKYCFYKIFDISIKKYNKVVQYAQYQVMYDLQWRLKSNSTNILSNDAIQQYRSEIIRLLNLIDDYIIIEQKYLDVPYKLYALSLKNDSDIKTHFDCCSNRVTYKNNVLIDLNKQKGIKILEIIEGQQDVSIIGEHALGILDDDLQIVAKDDRGMRYYLETIEKYRQQVFDGTYIHQKQKFKVEIPYNKVKYISFIIKNGEHNEKAISVSCPKNIGGHNRLGSFYALKTVLIKQIGRDLYIYNNRSIRKLYLIVQNLFNKLLFKIRKL